MFHNSDRRENNWCEIDNGRLKVRVRTKRVSRTDLAASDVIRVFASIWNLRRAHKDLGIQIASVHRLAIAFGKIQVTVEM
jgi:hypothetical protein